MDDSARWSELDLAVVDVEGNGARPPDLVELAMVPVRGGVIGEPMSLLVRPAEKISWQARRAHGITNADVAECPRFEDIADEVRQILAGSVPVGHGVKVGTIDGPSGGVGKTTTSSLLVERLRADGVPTHTTKEPSSSEIGQLAYKHVDTLRGHALACLFAADRYHHVTANIRPRLAAGESVVQDRYLASSLVMQRLDGVELDWLAGLNRRVEEPNLSVILTADPRIIGQRLSNRYQRSPVAAMRSRISAFAGSIGCGLPAVLLGHDVSPSAAEPHALRAVRRHVVHGGAWRA